MPHPLVALLPLATVLAVTWLSHDSLQQSEWTAGDAEISLLMPSRRDVLPVVRALSEHLRKEVPRVITGQR